jgi:hypothetical protein
MLVFAMFAGMAVNVNAAVGAYTVTFVTDANSSVQIGGVTVTSGTTAADGTLSFTTVTTAGYAVDRLTPDVSTEFIARNSSNNYTISNVEQNTTVTINSIEVWSGTFPTYDASAGFSGGSGTQAAPYQVNTAQDLAQLSVNVSSASGPLSYAGTYFQMTSDIFLNYSDTATTNRWAPIGLQATPFAGTFDGNGHLVCLLYYSDTQSATHIALFGSTTAAATVQNLGVTGTIGAYNYAAGVVAYNAGTVDSCFNAAAVTGNDSGTRGSGGVVGVNIGTISNCYNAGAVNNLYRPAGGITGITDTPAPTTPAVLNCYNVGAITSVGGSGYEGAIMATQNSSTIENCYYLTGSAPFAVAYPASTEGVSPQTTMQDPAFPATLNDDSGTAFAYDTYSVNGGYPILAWETYAVRPVPSNSNVTYTATFSPSGVNPIPAATVTNNSVSFTIVPTYATPTFTSVLVPAGSGAVVVQNSGYTYTVSNITSNITISVTADTAGVTSYQLPFVSSGDIEVLTPIFAIDGVSYANQNLLIDCTNQVTSLTVSNLLVTNGQTSIIDFAGTGNTLAYSGTNNILQETASDSAAIHVPPTASLTISGTTADALYLSKTSNAAGIGGNNGQVNGAVTFSGGNIFAVGTKSGAVIGTGFNAGAGAGSITFDNVQANLTTLSDAAAVGGASGGSIGTVTISNSAVNIVCAWNGAAIGVGSSASATSGSSLLINAANSSLYTSATANRQSVVPLVTVPAYSASTPTTQLYEADIEGVPSGTYTVALDGTSYLTGTTNTYSYIGGGTTVPANWSQGTTGTVGAWIPSGRHTLTATGVTATQTAMYNTAWGRFSVGVPVTLAPSGATAATLTAAQAAAGSGGIILVTGTTAIGTSETISDNTMLIARDSSLMGDVFTIASGSTLTMSGGIIDGESVSAAGSLVNVASGGILTVSGGILQNDINSGNGGAIAINSGTVTISGGTISGNTAVLGNGIYVAASNLLTLSPSGDDAITFDTNDDVYLPGGVSFTITEDLGTGINGTISLTFGNPTAGDSVAETQNEDMSESSIGKLIPSGTVSLDYDDTLIYIAATR